MYRSFIIALLIASGTFAAIDPRYELERDRKAPEILKVRVMTVNVVKTGRPCSVARGRGNDPGEEVHINVTTKLKVLETVRSQSGVKPGTVITTSYSGRHQACPGWVGPALTQPLKKGEVLYAFFYIINKNGEKWTSPGANFRSGRPDLSTP
jgi:hypothetical protein